MTNLIKSHSFIVKKANGVDDFRIQLRAAYWHSITNEKKLRKSIEDAIEQNIKDNQNVSYYEAMRTHYNNGNILRVLRDFGMLAGSERIIRQTK